MKKLAVLVVLLLCICLPVAAEQVSLSTPSPTGIPNLTLKPSSDEVKVYANPNAKANIVGYIITGGRQEVVVLRAKGDWYYVCFTSVYGTSYGWIPASCFQLTTPIPTATPTPAPVASTEAFICNPQKGYRLNLRTAPSATATSLGKYYTGTPVTLTGETRSGYSRVKIGTVTGWMDSRYLTTDPYAFVSELPQVYVVNPGGGLNLRYGPGTSTRKLGWYAHGSAITVLGVREDEWYHVAIGGQTGYMSNELMSETFPWQYGTDSDHSGVSSSSDTETTAYIRTGTGSGVHLRKYASASSSSLGVFYTGCPVRIISYTRTGWACVSIGEMQGYMDISCLVSAKPAQSGKQRIISNPYGTGLNLRTLPTTDSTVIRLCRNSTRVTVLGDLTDGWCYVQSGADQGYMMGTRLIDR